MSNQALYEVMRYARQQRRQAILLELMALEIQMIALGEIEGFTKPPNRRNGERSKVEQAALRARKQISGGL